METLHSKQKKILELLKTNASNPLTIKDLSFAADIGSPGVFYHHLTQLEKKGYLKRNPNNSRDYIILDSPESNVVYVGQYGLATCGPGGNILDGNPIEYIPIASSLLRFPSIEAFIVEAKGDSMEPKIFEGDIIIAKRQNMANHGDIVVCSLNEKVLIKKFIYSNDIVSLVSFNQECYHPIRVLEDDSFIISGVVKNILHYS